ncbi:MAG TPA: hypothetical protein VFV84_15040, partial [Burkholderiales bacterium]|nr:hypothetical protein [Burkholderiales bacterium]
MAKHAGEAEDPRRTFLLRALAAGLLAAGSAGRAGAQLFGRRPQPLPAGQSIFEATGPVSVDGQAAGAQTRVGARARIETGKGARLIFVVGSDAFLLREQSRLELDGEGALVNVMRLAAGALLSVFGRSSKRFVTPTSTIGIRGTGLYVESDPERSYVCTCYGETRIGTPDDPNLAETIVSKHHDAPRYVLKPGAARRIQPAPFINHTDVELALIEALVGRTPPFSM